jgi:hypothetical protein
MYASFMYKPVRITRVGNTGKRMYKVVHGGCAVSGLYRPGGAEAPHCPPPYESRATLPPQSFVPVRLPLTSCADNDNVSSLRGPCLMPITQAVADVPGHERGLCLRFFFGRPNHLTLPISLPAFMAKQLGHFELSVQMVWFQLTCDHRQHQSVLRSKLG